MLLDEEQVHRFEEDGFLAIEHLIDEATVEELRQAYDDVLEGRVASQYDRYLGGITRQVMMPSEAHPAFRENAALDAGKLIAKQVLGEAILTFDMAIYKPPGHPHETPWHQDMAYSQIPVAPVGAPIPNSMIQFWVALDDVDVENGCMHFLPGYHRKPLLEHHVVSGEPDATNRLLAFVDVEKQVDLSKTVAAPLPPGGATMHAYGTPHYTPPNRSTDRPRRAWIFNLSARDALRQLSRGATPEDMAKFEEKMREEARRSR